MEKLILGFICLLTFKSLQPINGGNINRQVRRSSEEQFDGPYVQYKNDQVYASYIMESNGTKSLKTDSLPVKQKNNLVLNVSTDIPGKTFQVRLKKKLQYERSEFHAIKNLVVLSDIEGNFSALRKLLLATNVIDENLNWKFGDGNLVMTGDFFDRGEQVTEVLWLIYSLEEKAKAAGGYVHFVLGNHEIMNLSGDLRYTQQKYLDDAAFLRQMYVSLYDENSELGRWLRTKNIVEKIGSFVFVHGGISGDVNRLGISIQDINKLARPFYADSIFKYDDPRSEIIFSDLGPFWYRGYYLKKDPGILFQIDSTLSLFSATHIMTGHTIVADTISVWYDGKLFDTDVHHAAGRSEALVIEGKKYYRVNQEGKKVLLMVSDN
jgi:hypothetical protein